MLIAGFCFLSWFSYGQNEKFDSLSTKIKEIAKIWESGRGITKSATTRSSFWRNNTVIQSKFTINEREYKKIRRKKYSKSGVIEKIIVKNEEGGDICRIKRINGDDVSIIVSNKGKVYELFIDRFIRIRGLGERDLYYEKPIN